MANSSNYQIVKQDRECSYLVTPIYVNEKFQVLFPGFDTEYSDPQTVEQSVSINSKAHRERWRGSVTSTERFY